MKKKTLLTLPFLFCLVSCESSSTFKDSRDGKEYKIVKIGEQVWMAENLNYATGVHRCYDDDEEKCNKYGRHYDWNTAKEACPKGWHLPSNEEWGKLYRFADSSMAGKHLKSKTEWDGLDTYGFAALPSGYSNSGGDFARLGDLTIWWSASDTTDRYAYDWNMQSGKDVASWYLGHKSWLLNVRCVRD
jgi:uncharacterized protein (TIGR02145 family)